MSEFQTKALATAAGLAVGVGGAAAGNVLHLDLASAQPAPQERVADLVNPALPRFGGSLVFSNGQFTSRLEHLDALLASNSNNDANKKWQSLEKKCPHHANINLGKPGGNKDSRDPFISSSVVIETDHKNIYKYKLHKGAKFCGIGLMRRDYSIAFPNPTKKSSKGGYYFDKYANTDKGVYSIAFYAKK